MKKLLISVFALFIICINVTAQEKSKNELRGDKFVFRYYYVKAIEAYNHSKHLSVEGQRRLAESYHKIDLNIKSEEVYSKLIIQPVGVLSEDYYNYAMVLKINGKYDEAGKWMDRFAELKPNDLRVQDYIAHKADLPGLLKDNGKYKIEHLLVNTDAEEFGTCYYKNKIVFASSRSPKKMIVRKYNWTGKPFWDMYISDVDGKQLKTPKNFDKGLNGKWHDGPASFSNNGNFMAFTRNNYHDKTKDKVVELQIYFSVYKGGKWQKPEPFIYNKPEYSVGQPCLTSDGNTMYFTSDMPGGFGKADIYRTTKEIGGAWGKPENLGNKINTEGDEMYPYFEENNKKLFFTSNGRFGLGGLDIFISEMNGPEPGIAMNAGYPLNTRFDDFAAIVNNKMTSGYFTSNSDGGSGGDDIYSFDLLDTPDIDVQFSVIAPENIPVERRVREYFPLRNYVFFNLGSTEIPDRYVLLKKDQVKDFKEDQLEVFTPKNLTGRSKRQMTVYYNIINILGDRMEKNPTATVKLSGASMQGIEDGMAMAKSVKLYLVDVFGIDSSRITTEGSIKPRIPSEQPGGIHELDLLREGDHRVSISSTSPAILMEFQSGPDAPLKPVEIVTVQEAPLDSYISFNVAGGDLAFSSWSMEIKDENNKVQYFGPYLRENVAIEGKFILGDSSHGNYKVTMIGQTKSGKTITKDTTVHIALWTPPQNEEMMRFSIIYEFNNSKAITIYEKYLTDIIIPKIPKNGTVIIHGYTDIIGNEIYNQKLSFSRAMDARNIFENGLSNLGRKDVKFEVYGFGEDLNFSPFDNKFPEERFYNRTVIIDIIPPN